MQPSPHLPTSHTRPLILRSGPVGYLLRRLYRQRQAVIVVAPAMTLLVGIAFSTHDRIGPPELAIAGMLGALSGIAVAVGLDRLATQRRRALTPARVRLPVIPHDVAEGDEFEVEEIAEPTPPPTSPKFGDLAPPVGAKSPQNAGRSKQAVLVRTAGRRAGNGATSLPISPSMARLVDPNATARRRPKPRPSSVGSTPEATNLRPATRTRAARPRRAS